MLERVSSAVGLNRRVVLGALLLAAAAAVGFLGSFQVGPDEVAVAGSGRVYGPGRHWSLPVGAAPLRLPHKPIPYSARLELPGPVVLDMAGRFAVQPGREGAWIAAAGRQPFLDGIRSVVRDAIAKTPVAAERLFAPETRQRLALQAQAALDAAGAIASGFTVHAPADANPVAAAAARAVVAPLAKPTGRKILVVGWDGADWLIIRPLLAAGRLPNLRTLVERGASGELLATKPLLSPLIWTTIATGKRATEHGIADFLVKDTATGDMTPIGSDARRVHALWTILPAFDLRNDVVGWWATWPAEPTRGTLVTDRVAYQLFQYREDPSGFGKVHPPAAWDWVKGELVSADRIPHAEVARFVGVDAAQYEKAWQDLPPERRQENKINHLRKVVATTRSYHRIALNMLGQQSDLTLVYYEGTDTVGHLFARYLPPAMPEVTPEEVRRFGHALPEYYEWADELLGELVARAAPDTTVMLVSDHGFFTGEARPRVDPSDFTSGAPQWHRLHGIVVAAGPGIPRTTLADATVLDIAPTVLALLGLPVAADMPGRPLFGAGDAAPRTLATYEVLPRSAAAAEPRSAALDEERVRELAALGYVSAGAVKGSGAAAVPPGGGEAGATESFATQSYNLARMHHDRGDLDAAAEQYRTTIDRLPSFGLGWAGLAQIETVRSRHREAFDLLVEGFRNGPSMPLGSITGLVEIGEKAGRLPEAERVLSALPQSYKGEPAYHAAWGLLYEKKGEPVEALKAYSRALEGNALDELALDRTVGLLKRLGKEKEAQAFLEEAVGHATGQVQALNHLAVVAMRQGWGRTAEGILRRVLRSDPGNPGVLANLAVSLGQQRRMREASDTMAESVRRDPSNAQNHFNLGAMLVDQGRLDEGLAAFEQAEARGLRTSRVRVAMAKVRFRKGDAAGSRRDLEQALAIDPNDREARQLLDRLR